MACDGFRIDRRAWLGWMSWRANSSQFLRMSFSCSLMRTFAYGGFGCASLASSSDPMHDPRGAGLRLDRECGGTHC